MVSSSAVVQDRVTPPLTRYLSHRFSDIVSPGAMAVCYSCSVVPQKEKNVHRLVASKKRKHGFVLLTKDRVLRVSDTDKESSASIRHGPQQAEDDVDLA
jgi:hypothetical protein